MADKVMNAKLEKILDATVDMKKFFYDVHQKTVNEKLDVIADLKQQLQALECQVLSQNTEMEFLKNDRNKAVLEAAHNRGEADKFKSLLEQQVLFSKEVQATLKQFTDRSSQVMGSIMHQSPASNPSIQDICRVMEALRSPAAPMTNPPAPVPSPATPTNSDFQAFMAFQNMMKR